MEAAQPTSIISKPLTPPPETPLLFDNDYEEEEAHYDDDYESELMIPKPSEWFPKLVSLQVDLTYNCITTLSAPIFTLFSLAYESYHQVKETKGTVELAVHQVPFTLARGSIILLKKLGFGFLGAAYLCMVLVMVLILSALFGIGLVNLWVEEPVFVTERLHFDYTEPNPTALFAFGTTSGNNYYQHKTYISRKHMGGVPVGHTFYVSLVLLMPESDYNRGIGVFQMSAELLSDNSDVIAKSSQPCMLGFKSLPVRLTRTFVMGIPLLLGISGETQKLTMQIIKHKEGHYPRTQAIRVSIYPRAGTSYLPQLYEAEIVINSQLPWTKQLVHSWKWTLYVWTSWYIYVMFLIFLILCCKPLLLPVTMIACTTTAAEVGEVVLKRVRESATQLPRRRQRESQATSKHNASDQDDVQELLRKWQRSRSKRKAICWKVGDLNMPAAETVGSSAASTISITREDASVGVGAEDVGDSESVCS